MKHIFYKPKESVYQTIVIYPIKDDSHPKDITIFNNIIASHTWVLTLDEFTNSFNDASQLDYLEAEYKEKVVKAYLANKQEFPNEDLMYFDGSFSSLDKTLIAHYSQNEKMLERILRDYNPAIRTELTGRTDLPEHIANKLIFDSDRNVRLKMATDYPLSIEQIKLYAKEQDEDIPYHFFKRYYRAFNEETIEYFIQNRTNAIKRYLSHPYISGITLTSDQVEFLSKPQNSCLRTKENLISYHKLPEHIINSFLCDSRFNVLERGRLTRVLASNSDYLTNAIVDKIIEINKNSCKFRLFENYELRLIENYGLLKNSPSVYQYATLEILKFNDVSWFSMSAIDYYLEHQKEINLPLPINLLEHLVLVNNKKCNLIFANKLLHIQGIPQYLAESIIVNTLINYKVTNPSKEGKEYNNFGRDTKYQLMIKQVMDYASGLKFMPPSLSSIFEFRLKV